MSQTSPRAQHWGIDSSAAELQRGNILREKTQNYSDKVRLQARKTAESKSVQSPWGGKRTRSPPEVRRSWSPVARRVPPPFAATFSGNGHFISPYLVSPRAPRSTSPSMLRETADLNEAGVFSTEPEWCSRHHVGWSVNNTTLPKTKRIYFDPLPQVSVIAGSYSDVPVFFPDSGADHNRHDLQRRWQTRHYPFKTPEPPRSGATTAIHPGSSCSEQHTSHKAGDPGSAGEKAVLTLPLLPQLGDVKESEDQVSELPRRTSIRRASSSGLGQGHARASIRKRTSRKSIARASMLGQISRAKTLQRSKGAMAGISSASCLGHFNEWCHEKYGHLVRVFRLLDKTGNMKLNKIEFKMGLHQLMYNKHDLERLWQILDRDGTGWVSFLHFAPEDAVVLAHFKHWVDGTFGNAAAAFKALDTSRDGKISYSEFSKGLKKFGFTDQVNTCLRTLFELIDDAGDESSKRCITADEIAFLDKWECPEYLWAEPDDVAKDQFLRATIDRYHKNPLLAWRKALDTDSSMRVSYYEFIKAYKSLSQRHVFSANMAKSVPALFRALDGSTTGWLSLRDFHEQTYHSLTAFSSWATEQFGKVSLSCKALAGPDHGDKVTFKYFRRAVKEGLSLDNDQAWQLFEGLSLESKKDGKITPDELFFLDRWDFKAELEEEMAWDKMMKDLDHQLQGEKIDPHDTVVSPDFPD